MMLGAVCGLSRCETATHIRVSPMPRTTLRMLRRQPTGAGQHMVGQYNQAATNSRRVHPILMLSHNADIHTCGP